MRRWWCNSENPYWYWSGVQALQQPRCLWEDIRYSPFRCWCSCSRSWGTNSPGANQRTTGGDKSEGTSPPAAPPFDASESRATRHPMPWSKHCWNEMVCLSTVERVQQRPTRETPSWNCGDMDRSNEEGLCCCLCPIQAGTIYPQMVVGCDDRLNRVLLEELNDLGEWDSYSHYFHYSFALHYKSCQHPNTRSK